MEKNKRVILKVENLTVTYGPIIGIKGINMEIKEGEIVVLLGANGAGKSTLLNAILGIVPSRSGHIIFQDEDITNKATDRIVTSGICLLPEDRGILPKMLVYENLQLGGYHSKTAVIKEDMERVFKRFPILKERRLQLAGKLSGGQQQILSIGRGLMAKPNLLMLDEPSLGLAPVIIDSVFKIIEELNKEGYSILLSEQNIRKALQVADRGYIFEKGQIVLSGLAKELGKNIKVKDAYLGGHIHKMTHENLE